MANLGHFLIRTSAFLRKEMVEVLRQPRLILALIFGPFLILLLFGLGYRNEARPVRTVFVLDQNSELAKNIQQDAPNISPQLIYAGSVQDIETARRMLANNQVNMVVVVPDNPNATIRNNRQAVFEIYHNEIDPAQVSYIEYLGQILVEEVNRRVLSSVAQEGQSTAADVQQDVRAARQNAANMRQALAAGNVDQARSEQSQMRGNISAVAQAVGASVGLLSGVEQNVGSGGENGQAQEILTLLDRVQNNQASKGELQSNQSGYDQEIQQLDQQEKDLEELDSKLSEFQSISPAVLTRPFAIATHSMSPFEFTPMNFFTPGVIALLLQHITVTIAALSIVRERRAGTIELFRVSPIKASEILSGKYISYMIFGIVIAAVLGLITLTPVLEGYLARLPRWATLALAASIGAQLAVIPIIAGHFGTISPLSPLASVPATPSRTR